MKKLNLSLMIFLARGFEFTDYGWEGPDGQGFEKVYDDEDYKMLYLDSSESMLKVVEEMQSDKYKSTCVLKKAQDLEILFSNNTWKSNFMDTKFSSLSECLSSNILHILSCDQDLVNKYTKFANENSYYVNVFEEFEAQDNESRNN